MNELRVFSNAEFDMEKAKEIGIDIGVSVNVPDETAGFCIAVLNNWMKNGDRRLELCEKEDGTQFLIESGF